MRFFRSVLICLLFAAAILWPFALVAQTNYTTNVVLTHLLSGGSPIASATVCLTPADQYGNAVSISAPTWGLLMANTPLCGTVTNGAISGGVSVPDSNHTNSATPVRYNVTIQALTNGVPVGQAIQLTAVPNITGPSWDLDNYSIPASAPTPTAVFATGPGVPSSCSQPSIDIDTNTNSVYYCGSGGTYALMASANVNSSTIAAAVVNPTYADTIIAYPLVTPNTGTVTGGGGYYGDNNTVMGSGAGQAITTAREMTIFGAQACQAYAGYTGTTGLLQTENGLSTCIGSQAGAHLLSTGFDGSVDNVFLGQKSGTNVVNSQACTYLGTHTGTPLTGCLNSTIAGGHAIDTGTGGIATGVTVLGAYAANGAGSKSYDTIVGAGAAGVMTTAVNTDCIGYDSCLNLTTGSNNEVFGYNAGGGIVAGSNMTIFGYNAGPSVDASGSLYIGYYAGNGVATDNGQNTIIGRQTANHVTSLSYSVFIGDSIGGGGTAGNINQTTVTGSQAGANLGTSSGNTFDGYKNGTNVTTGSNNTLVGAAVAEGLITGSNNSCFGVGACALLTGSESGNTAIGANAEVAANVSGAIQVGSGTNSTPGTFQVNSTTVLDANADVHHSTATPADNATCSVGAIRADANYVYVCTATNTWKRAALTSY